MRQRTERSEGIEAGTVGLVGIDGEQTQPFVRSLLNDPDAYAEMSRAENPYGDGRASERIMGAIADFARLPSSETAP